jgi:toxin HigB-1
MIATWKHKGLRLFFQKGITSGIQTKHKNKLKIVLQLLDAASKPEDMNLPGMRFHTLKGNYKNYYSVTISGNWRVIYKFEGTDAILVDYLDYH